MIRETLSVALMSLLCTPFVLLMFENVGAQVMQSTNYQLESDSINFGGGLSASDSYQLESTGGEVATGDSTSSNYNLRAGYQQMGFTYISLTGAETVALSPSIPGVAGGESNGSTTLNVATDNPAGYSLTIEAANTPAMQSLTDVINDYVPEGSVPDYTFAIEPTDSHFGYSPEGVHITDRFRDNGSACGVGSGDTSLACWDGLTTSPVVIATDAVSNHPLGTDTIVHFRVGVGGSVLQEPGLYVATTTVTAIPL